MGTCRETLRSRNPRNGKDPGKRSVDFALLIFMCLVGFACDVWEGIGVLGASNIRPVSPFFFVLSGLFSVKTVILLGIVFQN